MPIGMNLGNYRQKFTRKRRCVLIIAAQLGQADLIGEDFNQQPRVEISNRAAPLPRVSQPFSRLGVVLRIGPDQSKRSSCRRLPTRIAELITESESLFQFVLRGIAYFMQGDPYFREE